MPPHNNNKTGASSSGHQTLDILSSKMENYLNIPLKWFVNLFFGLQQKCEIYYCNTKDEHEHILKFPQKYGMLETKWKIEC